MHDRLQLLKHYLNARAEVLRTDAGADFSDLDLNIGSLGASFWGTTQTVVRFHVWLPLPLLISRFEVALKEKKKQRCFRDLRQRRSDAG